MTLGWYLQMNLSLHTRKSQDDKSIRFQSGSLVLLRTWKQAILSCKVYSISTMRTLTWEGIEFGNFILIASIHLWNQSIENFTWSSPLRCNFVTSLLLICQRTFAAIKLNSHCHETWKCLWTKTNKASREWFAKIVFDNRIGIIISLKCLWTKEYNFRCYVRRKV